MGMKMKNMMLLPLKCYMKIKKKILNKKENSDQSVKTLSHQKFHQFLEAVIKNKKRKKRRKKIKNEDDHQHYQSYYHLDQRLLRIIIQMTMMRILQSMKRLNKINILKMMIMKMMNRNHYQMNIPMMMK